MADKEEKKAFPPKRPSVLKNKLQNDQRKARNKSNKSRVLTAIRSVMSSITNKESEDQKNEKLSTLYSLVDKGVKTGIFKPNKAARTKARITTRVNAS